jgi:hypothetical protein
MTRSTYDLSVRTEVGRKSTTNCIYFHGGKYIHPLTCLNNTDIYGSEDGWPDTYVQLALENKITGVTRH